jgi:opacity protein-like surface antigen
MKKQLFLLLLVLSLFIPQYFAQDSTQNSLKEGKFALQFRLDGSFTLKAFQGSSFSAKYHTSDFFAVRTGVMISNYSQIYNKYNGIDTSTSNSLEVEFISELIYYLKVVDDIALFTGGGLSYSTYRNENQNNDNTDWAIGLSGIIGMEWFVKKNISLSAEYNLQLKYADSNHEGYISGKWTQIHYTSFYVSSYNQFKIGVSLYL